MLELEPDDLLQQVSGSPILGVSTPHVKLKPTTTLSIHKIRAPFVRCDYRPTTLDARKRHHNPPPPQHGLRFFFGGVIGTDTEKKLAQLMAKATAPVTMARQQKGAA